MQSVWGGQEEKAVGQAKPGAALACAALEDEAGLGRG